MKTTKTIIRIFDEVGGDAAISVSEGDVICKKTDAAIADGLIVVLDFQDIHLMTTAFLHACIGQLHGKYSNEELHQYLELENIKDEDKHLFFKTRKRAKKYFANPDDFHQSVKKAMGHEHDS